MVTMCKINLQPQVGLQNCRTQFHLMYTFVEIYLFVAGLMTFIWFESQGRRKGKTASCIFSVSSCPVYLNFVYIQVVLRRWHSSFSKVWHIFQEGIWEPPLSPFYRFADSFDLANTLPVLKRLITSPALLPTSFLTYHVFTRMPGDSYRSCFGSLLLCPSLYVRRLSSTINSPLGCRFLSSRV